MNLSMCVLRILLNNFLSIFRFESLSLCGFRSACLIGLRCAYMQLWAPPGGCRDNHKKHNHSCPFVVVLFWQLQYWLKQSYRLLRFSFLLGPTTFLVYLIALLCASSYRKEQRPKAANQWQRKRIYQINIFVKTFTLGPWQNSQLYESPYILSLDELLWPYIGVHVKLS